jgi:glycine cleavage system protein P-like pyridoxal-binding family
MQECLLVNATEMHTQEQMDKFVKKVKGVLSHIE